MRVDKQGFSVVIVLISVVIVLAAGYFGWRVYDRRVNSDNGGVYNAVEQGPSGENEPMVTDQSQSTNDNEIITLASGDISFSTPESWEPEGIGCFKDGIPWSGQVYLDSVSILPGEKLRTIYGNGTEYFEIYVCVFENTENLTAEDWYTGVGFGVGTGGDERLASTLNGYDYYFYKQNSPYEQVNYVLASNEKVVLVWARLLETDDSLPGVGDFRKFEQPISEMIESIRIQ